MDHIRATMLSFDARWSTSMGGVKQKTELVRVCLRLIALGVAFWSLG